MLKRLLITTLLLVSLFVPKYVNAQEQVCTQVYGGGVICGAKHEVVETGLGENLALIGGLFIASSGILLWFEKRSNFSKKSKNLVPQN